MRNRGRCSCPQELRAAYDFGQKGVQTEARRPKKKKKKKKGTKQKMACHIGEDLTMRNPGRYSCPQELRAAYDFGQKGVQTEVRRPKKKKKNIRRKEGSKRWHDTLAKI
jgi:hypothetical protein